MNYNVNELLSTLKSEVDFNSLTDLSQKISYLKFIEDYYPGVCVSELDYSTSGGASPANWLNPMTVDGTELANELEKYISGYTFDALREDGTIVLTDKVYNLNVMLTDQIASGITEGMSYIKVGANVVLMMYLASLLVTVGSGNKRTSTVATGNGGYTYHDKWLLPSTMYPESDKAQMPVVYRDATGALRKGYLVMDDMPSPSFIYGQKYSTSVGVENDMSTFKLFVASLFPSDNGNTLFGLSGLLDATIYSWITTNIYHPFGWDGDVIAHTSFDRNDGDPWTWNRVDNLSGVHDPGGHSRIHTDRYTNHSRSALRTIKASELSLFDDSRITDYIGGNIGDPTNMFSGGFIVNNYESIDASITARIYLRLPIRGTEMPSPGNDWIIDHSIYDQAHVSFNCDSSAGSSGTFTISTNTLSKKELYGGTHQSFDNLVAPIKLSDGTFVDLFDEKAVVSRVTPSDYVDLLTLRTRYSAAVPLPAPIVYIPSAYSLDELVEDSYSTVHTPMATHKMNSKLLDDLAVVTFAKEYLYSDGAETETPQLLLQEKRGAAEIVIKDPENVYGDQILSLIVGDEQAGYYLSLLKRQEAQLISEITILNLLSEAAIRDAQSPTVKMQSMLDSVQDTIEKIYKDTNMRASAGFGNDYNSIMMSEAQTKIDALYDAKGKLRDIITRVDTDNMDVMEAFMMSKQLDASMLDDESDLPTYSSNTYLEYGFEGINDYLEEIDTNKIMAGFKLLKNTLAQGFTSLINGVSNFSNRIAGVMVTDGVSVHCKPGYDMDTLGMPMFTWKDTTDFIHEQGVIIPPGSKDSVSVTVLNHCTMVAERIASDVAKYRIAVYLNTDDMLQTDVDSDVAFRDYCNQKFKSAIAEAAAISEKLNVNTTVTIVYDDAKLDTATDTANTEIQTAVIARRLSEASVKENWGIMEKLGVALFPYVMEKSKAVAAFLKSSEQRAYTDGTSLDLHRSFITNFDMLAFARTTTPYLVGKYIIDSDDTREEIFNYMTLADYVDAVQVTYNGIGMDAKALFMNTFNDIYASIMTEARKIPKGSNIPQLVKDTAKFQGYFMNRRPGGRVFPMNDAQYKSESLKFVSTTAVGAASVILLNWGGAVILPGILKAAGYGITSAVAVNRHRELMKAIGDAELATSELAKQIVNEGDNITNITNNNVVSGPQTIIRT